MSLIDFYDYLVHNTPIRKLLRGIGTTMHTSSVQGQCAFTLTGDKAWQELTVGDTVIVTWEPRRNLTFELTEVVGRTFKGKTAQGRHIIGSFSPETGKGFATVSYG